MENKNIYLVARQNIMHRVGINLTIINKMKKYNKAQIQKQIHLNNIELLKYLLDNNIIIDEINQNKILKNFYNKNSNIYMYSNID